MTLIERYAVREIAAPTAVGFAVYTLFMLFRGLIQFSDLLLQSGDPFRSTALVVAFSLPHIVVLTLPIAFLLGILIGIGRLSADSELVALRAAGGDLVRLYRPIGFLGVLLWLVTGIVMVLVVPRTNRILYGMKLQLSTFAIAQRIQPGVFSPDLGGRRVYVEKATADRRSLEGIIVSDRSDPADGDRLTLARRGALELEEAEGRLWLRLEDASTFHTRTDPKVLDRSSYLTQRVLLDDTNPRDRLSSVSYVKQLREQTLEELIAGTGRISEPERRLAWVEIHKKFALPAACLVFAFIGLPLGIVNRRGGRAAGFAISAAIVLGYYLLLASGEAWAIDGSASPVLAMWLPNMLLTVLGALALVRVRRDRTLFEADGLLSALDRLRDRLPRPRGAPAPVSAPSRRKPMTSWLIDRYVARRFLKLFALVLASILILYVLIDYMEISDDIARNRPPARIILAYYQAKIAPILVDVVPFSFLAAALIATAGLVRSSETTALLSHGVSLMRQALSILVLAALTGAGLFAFSERIVPTAAVESERLRDVILNRPTPPAPSDTAQSWLRGEAGRFFWSETYDPRTLKATGVGILDVNPDGFKLRQRTWAETGLMIPGRGILIADGWTRTFSATGASLFLRRTEPYVYDAPEVARVFQAGRSDPRRMTTLELGRYIRARRKAGADVAALATGLYQKSALALSPLLLTLVGLPFAFHYGRRGAVAGVGIALFLGLGYLILSTVLVKAGETGALPPLLAAWGSNGFFGCAAGYGLLGIRT